jgi:Zn-dependent metalloprotease
MTRPTLARLTTILALASVACFAGCDPTANSKRPEAAYAPEVEAALGSLPRVEVLELNGDGQPSFLRGDLGRTTYVPGLDAAALENMLQGHLAQVAAVFRLRPDDLRFRFAESDHLGYLHARYAQHANGLEVVGGEVILHLDAQGTIYAVNGDTREVTLGSAPTVSHTAALEQARAAAAQDGSFTFEPGRLVYVISTLDEQLHLAWEIVQEGTIGADPVLDLVYVDALTGGVAERRPQIHYNLTRKVYDAQNGTSIPGVLKLSEGGSAVSDQAVMDAYNHTGTTYDFYKTRFGRDSYDNAGAVLVSTVHYDDNYNNAYWSSYYKQFVFGDGDGQQLSNLSGALDVIAHELTHAVTTSTANLTYSNESGALNEGLSDILSASCEAWKRGGVSEATWMVGEDVWTPATSGDALRYMNNPTKDGISYDYYPERYTGTSDYGGVHLNSGIANLAFYLLSQGGKHPRGKTTVEVTGIGLENASAIFYRALTQYMTSTTNFSKARTATVQAATDLLGAGAATNVNAAWDAVGVGGGPTPPPTTVVLTNGVPKTGLSGAKGDQLLFSLAVPENATNLKFQLAGGTGDPDLYVRFAEQPTTTTYDSKSTGSSTSETVSVTSASKGTYYVLVYAYAAFSSVSLTGSYSTGGSGTDVVVLQNGTAVNNLAGAKGSQVFYSFDVPTTAKTITFQISGGTGDADLYVRYGNKPTTSTWDYRPYKSGNNETVSVSTAKSGTWYLMLNGYSAYTGVKLVASYQ